jgi:predicted MFS family arabinose efflux permease
LSAKDYSEFRDGWRIVLAAAIGVGLGMSPLPFYTIGVFAAPLTAEFGWNMKQIMSSMLLFTAGAVVMAPLIGGIADKFGPRKVILTSTVLFSLSMMSFSLMQGSLVTYLFIWGTLAVVGSGTLPIAWTRVINVKFDRKRGLALGLALIGTGLFGVLAKQLAYFLIEAVGWRLAYVGVGALPLVFAWPLAFFLLRDPQDSAVKTAPDIKDSKLVSDKGFAGKGGLTLKECFRDWRFWLVIGCFIPISFAVGGPIPNLETILHSKGFSSGDAVALASIIGIAIVTGRGLGGYLLDHIWAPAVAAVVLGAPALTIMLLAQPEVSYVQAAMAIAAVGFAAGVKYDLMPYLVPRYFGLRQSATIYGIVYAAFALGAGIGPAVFGALYESMGSYDFVLRLTAVLFLMGSLPLLLLGKYRVYPNDVSNESPDTDER